MKELLGTYRQDFDEIRRLCLQCHGLDLTSSSLFTRSTYEAVSERTKEVLDAHESVSETAGMLSSSLLTLAVAIRTMVYQGRIAGIGESLDLLAASYYEESDRMVRKVTVKDVCDKIIHAESVSKTVFPAELMLGDVKVAFQFQGAHRGTCWTLDLSLEVFTESILNLLHRIEAEAPPQRP